MSTENTTPAPQTTVTETIDPATVAATIAADAPRVSDNTAPTPQPAAAPQPTAPAANVEIDAAGVPFDPKRHLPKKHPRTRRWMPRKPSKNTANATDTPQNAAPATPQSTVPVSQITATPAAPTAPEPTAWSDAERAEAAKSTAPQNGEPTAATPQTANNGSQDAAAEIACEATEFFTGLATGEPAEAEMSAPQRKAMRNALSAYLVSKGWQCVGGVLLTLLTVGYFIATLKKPKTSAKLREWWRGRNAKKVEGTAVTTRPVEQPKPAAPAVEATPAPVQTAKPGQPLGTVSAFGAQ